MLTREDSQRKRRSDSVDFCPSCIDRVLHRSMKNLMGRARLLKEADDWSVYLVDRKSVV
jgi:hypothetical protein